MEILKELRYCCETSFGDSFGLQVNLADSLMANEAERYVLKAEVFSSFESTVVKSKPLTFSRIYADDAIENRRIEMLKNCVYMHHKAIFDCFNECLDY